MQQPYSSFFHYSFSYFTSFFKKKQRVRLIACFAVFELMIGGFAIQAQPFSDQSALLPVGISGYNDAYVSWGDYDRDGDLDALIMGQTATTTYDTRVLRNDPGGFVAIPSLYANLPDLRKGIAVWGDYNEDGKLGILIAGENVGGQAITEIYQLNNVSSAFIKDNTASAAITGALFQVKNACADWGDYDNDGDLDLLLSGNTGGGVDAKIFKNTGGSTFSEDVVASANITGVENGTVKWADMDNDGYLDIIMTGNSSGPSTRIFRNSGVGTFSNVVTLLPNLKDGSIDAGDYDADGDLDILLTGTDIGGSNFFTKVFQNNGSNSYLDMSAAIPGVTNGHAAWGDMDSDGDLDVVITGKNGPAVTNRITQIYTNTGSGFNFQSSLTGADAGSHVAWGDYNGDRRLDLLYAGTGPSGRILKLYRNDGTSTNPLPSAPSGLSAVQVGQEMILSWTPPVSSSGFTYNLYVGNTGTLDTLKAPMSGINSGYRRIAAIGNVNHKTSWRLTGLAAGTYFWGVQAVDTDLEGSTFTTGTNFVYTPPTPGSLVFVDVTNVEFASPLPVGQTFSHIAFGDHDADGDLDFIVSGEVSGNRTTKVYRHFKNGVTYTENVVANGNIAEDMSKGFHAWGDYDGDGDLDLLISGITGPIVSPTRSSKIYRNDGNNVFTNINAPLEAMTNASGDWGDYDNDGDLDILLCGNALTGTKSLIYRNDGNDVFVEDVTASTSIIDGVEFGAVAWGDYDNDSYLDLLITGSNAGGIVIGKLYHNEQDGTFLATGTSLANIKNSDVDWGDYDNDGDLDIVMVGESPAGTPVSALYRNDGGGVFQIVTTSFPGIMSGSVEFGDYDNDGWLDLLMVGQNGVSSASRTAKVYQNNTLGGFNEDVVASGNLTAVNGGADAVWGDYNLDGKLDILLTGTSSGGTQVFKLYKNVDTGINTKPDPPENLMASLAGFEVDFSWDPPSAHPTASVDGLHYNLYVSSIPNATVGDVQAPNSRISDGYRQVIHLGNANVNTAFSLTGLAPGNYCWSVQAVDQDYEGSLFAAEQCFLYDAPTFIDTTVDVFPNGVPDGLLESDVAWADIDSDGDLDILATGGTASSTYSSNIYQYQAVTGVYGLAPIQSAAITNIREGTVSFADYDNDQDLDLLVSGLSASGRFSQVYRHLAGPLDYTPAGAAYAITALSKSASAWADYDNDGWVDLLIAGENGSGQPLTELYHNDAGAGFSVVTSGIQNLRDADIAWADFDEDGDPDVLVSGESATGPFSAIYENLGDGSFADIGAALVQLRKSSVAWGDYDKDGDFDVLITGETSGAVPTSLVYRNNAGTFTNISAPLAGVFAGSAAFGDYNHDGFLDIMLTGADGTGTEDRTSRLYEYSSALSNFVEDVTAQAPMDAVNGSEAVFGDYNNDSKLDILLTGRTSTSPLEATFQILHNNEPAVSPGPPAAPSNPVATLSGFDMLLSWTPPAGQNGLSYNIRVGNTSTDANVLSPLSNIFTGKRKVVGLGNTGQVSTEFPVRGLTGGTYNWSVQSIDADFEGSPWLSGGSFTYTPPTFLDMTTEQFPTLPVGVRESDLDWGDYDNDGDLDLLICGSVNAATSITAVYRNDAGAFTDIGAGLPGVANGSVAWGDYDNDGWLDILVSGEQGTLPFTEVYRNQNGASFADANAGLTQIKDGEAVWVDVNRDGYLDVLLTGEGPTGVGAVGEIFAYTPAGGFTSLGINLPGLIFSAAAVGDFDKDAYPDILLAGQNPAGGGAPLTVLLRNDANGGFVNTGVSFPGLRFPSLEWGDYDNDGHLDILMAGEITSPSVGELSRLFRNTGNGTFAAVSFAAAPLDNIKQGAARFGDFDDDGFLDIVLMGQSGLNRIAKAYRNDGNGAFAADDVVSLPFTQMDGGASIAFGDYNNDNKLDFVAAGRTSVSPSTAAVRLYENVDTVSNATPGVPTGLSSVVSGDTVILSWTPPAGGNGFSYNVYIGTTPGDLDQLSPMSDQSSGYRRVVRLGNAQSHTSLHLRELAGGTYYWSVQAVDQDYEGSPFAAEQSFQYVPPTLVNNTPLIISPAPDGINNGKLSWIDADQDGDLDLMVTGEKATNDYVARIYRNNNGNFTLVFDTVGVRFAAVAWADYDLDGDADLLLSGQNSNGNRRTMLLRNNGANGLVSITNPFPDLLGSSADWGDYDNDGDPDLLISGSVGTNVFVTEVYRNDSATFVKDQYVSDLLPGVQFGAVSWGDYDGDGRLDILMTGESSIGLEARVFRNLGGSNFQDIGAAITAVKEGSAEWGDVDNDGWLDILMTGETSVAGFSPASRLFRYNSGTNAFVPYASGVLRDVKRGAAKFGDYDDDGLLDILLTGQDGPSSSDRTTRLYRNTGTGFVEEAGSSLGLENADQGSDVAWGDYDLDGKLDIALIGRVETSPATTRILSIYRNMDDAANLTANAPGSLTATPNADSVTFSWNPPAGYAAALVDGLSYNLYLGSAPVPADPDRISPLSALGTGYRRIVDMGPVRGTSWTIRDLPTGTWYWSVQAIEADFEASEFAAEQSFSFQAPVFVNQTAYVTRSGSAVGLDQSELSWGDYDNDNDLDLVLTGEGQGSPFFTAIWENVDGELQEDAAAAANLPAIRSGSVAWGDMNEDGELDLAILGETASGPVTRIYRQVNGVLSDVGANLPGLRFGSLSWVDFDRDGDLDLLISGEDNAGTPQTILFLNDGSEGFADSGLALPGLAESSGAWSDFDNDGWPDLLICGRDAAGQRFTGLFENDRDGGLVEISSALPNIMRGSIAWGDYDLDGWPDVLISGEDATGAVTQLYRNNGDDTFINTGINLVGIRHGKVAWGDYDNDGFPDFALTGQNGATTADRVTLIYHNDGGTAFTVDTSATAPFAAANTLSDLAWGDFSGDGKLDIVLTGRVNDTPVERVLAFYENNHPAANQALPAPDTLMNDASGADVLLSWAAPAGYDPALVKGLTYNVYVGTSPGAHDVLSAHSDVSGFRKIATAGNTAHASSIRITGLSDGTYYWSVQAVGPDWEGSPFAVESSFLFNQKAYKDVTSQVFPFANPQAVSEAALAFGDFDNNGFLDLVAAGALDNVTNSTTIYSNSMGLFQENAVAAANLTNVRKSTVDVDDYDNDGLLDILIAGLDESGSPVTQVYHNEGDGTFDLDVTASSALEPISEGSARWGDYNNDGLPDILLTGAASGGPFSRLYRNNGNSEFVPDTDAFDVGEPQPVSQSAVAWGDYDADGDLDFVLTGRAASGPFTGLYRNNGDETFTLISTPMLDVMQGSVAWGDYENDGDLDIVISGENSTNLFVPVTKLYVYDDNTGTFGDPSMPVSLLDVKSGSVSWGDYNNDGFSDILLSGRFGEEDTAVTTKIYRNDGGMGFSEDINTSSVLADVDLGQSIFGNFDNQDGLDIILSGQTNDNPPARAFGAYLNIDSTLNITPPPPRNLTSTVIGDKVELSWDAPDAFPPDRVSGLSYNIYVGTDVGLIDQFAPEASLVDGKRQIVSMGGTNLSTTWTITGLQPGTYFWSVQTVDQDFEGSPFAAEEFFLFINPAPVIIDSAYATVYVDTTDNAISSIEVEDTSVVDRIVVHYKGIAGADWSTLTLSDIGPTYEFPITPSLLDEIGIEYYFEAVGKFGFSAVTDTTYTYIRYTGDGLEIPSLRFGTTVRDYNIIAVPLDMDDRSIAGTIEDDLGTYNIFKWRFFHYQGGSNTEYKSGVTQMEAGKGYWLIAKDRDTVYTGAGETVKVHDRKPYALSLNQGWNQLGNPYNFKISWTEILDSNDVSVQDAFIEPFRNFENGWDTVGTPIIDEFRGGFVFSERAVELTIPVRKNPAIQRFGTSSGGLSLTNPLDQAEWDLKLRLSSGDLVNPFGGIGMRPDADSSRDQYDRISLPRLHEYLDITFDHPEHFAKRFMRDVIPTAKEAVWEFTLATNREEEDIRLSWDNSYFGNGSRQLILFDVEHQRQINMAERDNYLSTSTQQARKFRIYFGTPEFIASSLKPDHIHLGSAYPNPFMDQTTIAFSLPEIQQGSYEVRLYVLDQAGKRVRTLVDGPVGSGFQKRIWDGKNDRGDGVASGIYIYQLIVVHGGQQENVQQKGNTPVTGG